MAPFLRSYPTKITVRGSLILWLLFLLTHQHFRIIVLLCNCKLALHQVHHASGTNLFYLAPSLSPLPLSLSPSPTLIPSLPPPPLFPLFLPYPYSLSPSPTLIPSLPPPPLFPLFLPYPYSLSPSPTLIPSLPPPPLFPLSLPHPYSVSPSPTLIPSLPPPPLFPLSLPHPYSLSPPPPPPPLSPSLPPSLFSSSLQIVCHGKTVEEVTRHLGSLAPPFLTFRDASCGPPSYPSPSTTASQPSTRYRQYRMAGIFFRGLLLSCPVRGLTSFVGGGPLLGTCVQECGVGNTRVSLTERPRTF